MEETFEESCEFNFVTKTELVDEDGNFLGDNKKSVEVFFTNPAGIDFETLIDKFQEFMIQTGKCPDGYFDFGEKTLSVIIKEWHDRMTPSCVAEKVGEDVAPSKIKKEMDELVETFDELSNVFKKLMDSKASK